MVEFVYRRSRRIRGKRVRARTFTGCCTWRAGQKPVRVPLHTPDLRIARKRLREFILERQREEEGLIGPKLVRDAAATPLGALVADYRAYLVGRGLSKGWVRDTIKRIERVIDGCGWKKLSDINADTFLKFRATL